jgi:DNA repair exonuclease SbcCD ATPase subunit
VVIRRDTMDAKPMGELELGLRTLAVELLRGPDEVGKSSAQAIAGEIRAAAEKASALASRVAELEKALQELVTHVDGFNPNRGTNSPMMLRARAALRSADKAQLDRGKSRRQDLLDTDSPIRDEDCPVCGRVITGAEQHTCPETI